MEQYSSRSRTLLVLAGVSVLAVCTALILVFAGKEDRGKTLPQETADAETVEEHYRAEKVKGRETAGNISLEGKGKTESGTETERTQKTDLTVGIPARQVKSQEESYCLVSENGFLLVFAKDRNSICLDTHMPLSEFPLAEQERLLDGLWFSSMMEVFNYLESYTS